MSSQKGELVTVLQTLTDGLLWMSETDEPFEVFHWEGQLSSLTDAQLLERTHHPLGTTIKVVPFDDFFDAAIQKQDWFDAEEESIAARYQALVSALKQHLSDLKVYRMGEVKIDFYVVGQMKTGDVIGLATQAVET